MDGPDSGRAQSYMQEAFLEAEAALERSEVPVGCIFVHISHTGEESIIGRGGNLTNATKNATAHAELVAIDEILKSQPVDIFRHCELYVTVEPCIMCARFTLYYFWAFTVISYNYCPPPLASSLSTAP
jgi:tRNA(Arg) A34 adenosine deaminase TadA